MVRTKQRIYDLVYYYTEEIKIYFDPIKNNKNIVERGLSFEHMAEFDFTTATYLIDERYDYSEIRLCALGFVEQKFYTLVFVEISGGIRMIKT